MSRKRLCRSCFKVPGKVGILCEKCYRIKLKFGVNPKGIHRLAIEQGFKCRICKVEQSDNRSLAIDHDHESGKIRGLLCTSCNMALGKFNNIVLLQAAIDYLQAKNPRLTYYEPLQQVLKVKTHNEHIVKVMEDTSLSSLRAKARVLSTQLNILEDAALSRLRRYKHSHPNSAPLDNLPQYVVE